ncbi:MAG: hypothetical protein RLZZ210_305 [Pseudomonadota bacterium]
MNFYFIFEGKTEVKTYRKWFNALLPHLKEVKKYNQVNSNNYYCESDMGVPDCYNVLADAIQEINEFSQYDYLVLFIDADNLSVEEKKEEAHQLIKDKLQDKKYKKLPSNCKLKIIVQKVCIETWFLGNQKIIPKLPAGDILKEYMNYFDVRTNNPEELWSEFIDGESEKFGYKDKAEFHHGYLREVFKEHNKSYQKSNIREVQEEYYLQEIKKRIIQNAKHLQSFQELINFCARINEEIENKS